MFKNVFLYIALHAVAMVSYVHHYSRGTVKRITFTTINVCVLQIKTSLRCLMFAQESFYTVESVLAMNITWCEFALFKVCDSGPLAKFTNSSTSPS